MKSSLDRRSKRKCFRFHHDHGYDTEERHPLKNEIDALIRRGYISKYVWEQQNQASDEENNNNWPMIGIINTISTPASGV